MTQFNSRSKPGFLSFLFGKYHCKAAQEDFISSRTDGKVLKRGDGGLWVSQLARGLENRGAEDAELWAHWAGHGHQSHPILLGEGELATVARKHGSAP